MIDYFILHEVRVSSHHHHECVRRYILPSMRQSVNVRPYPYRSKEKGGFKRCNHTNPPQDRVLYLYYPLYINII